MKLVTGIAGRDHPQVGVVLHLEDQVALDGIGKVDLAVRDRGKARRVVRDHPQDQRGHLGRGAPEMLGRLEDDLVARRVFRQLVGARADGRVLEAFFAHAFHVGLGQHPGHTAGRRAEQGQEVGPGLAQLIADGQRIDHHRLGHELADQFLVRARVAVERELGILGGQRIAVLELEPLAQLEGIAQPVLGRFHAFGKAEAGRLALDRADQRVMHGILHDQRRAGARG